MITKKDLREIKDDLRGLVEKIEALQSQENFGKLSITDDLGFKESSSLVVETFIPRLLWFNKRLDKWINQVPAGKRGKTKKKETQNGSN